MRTRLVPLAIKVSRETHTRFLFCERLVKRSETRRCWAVPGNFEHLKRRSMLGLTRFQFHVSEHSRVAAHEILPAASEGHLQAVAHAVRLDRGFLFQGYHRIPFRIAE